MNDHEQQDKINRSTNNSNDWDRYFDKRIDQPRGEIGFWRSIGFGSFSAFSLAMQGMTGTWLLFFYTNFCGLTAFQGASIFTIGRFVDAFTTLIAGNVSDQLYRLKIGRKYGRRHIFIFAAAPASLLPILMWLPSMSYFYYLTSYLVTNIALSFLEIPYDTLSNEMTTDYGERTKLATARMVLAGAFAPLVSWIMVISFKTLGKTSAMPFIVSQLIISLFSFVLVLVTFYTTWEHFITKAEAKRNLGSDFQDSVKRHRLGSKHMLAIGQVAIKRYFSTFRIKTYRTHLLIFGLAYLAASVWGTVFVYYVVNVLNESQTNVAYLQMFSIVSIPVTIIAGRAITKITPRTLYFIAFGLVLVSCVEVGLLGVSQPKDTMSWLIWVSFIYNVGQYILWFIPWSIFPYIPDLDTLITGQNRSGVFAAVMMFFYQTFYAIGSVAVGMLLDVSGFVKSSAGTIPQPESAKNMIIIMISLGVGSLIIGAWWSASKLKLNQTTIGIVTREVKRLKAGGDMADVKANTKQVCEMLTGIRYDSIKVWKNSRRRK